MSLLLRRVSNLFIVAPVGPSLLLLETGDPDNLLLETGDALLLE